jgi:hypothetical protein
MAVPCLHERSKLKIGGRGICSNELALNYLRAFLLLRASPAVLSTDRAKVFVTSKISFWVFFNPTYRSKTDTANRWETTNSE